MTLYKNKKHGLQTSGHQFLFWFLCALCGAFQFRSEIRGGQIDNQFLYHTYLIYYPLVCAMFLVNFLPDDPPKVNIYSKQEVRTIKNKVKTLYQFCFPRILAQLLAQVISEEYSTLTTILYCLKGLNDPYNLRISGTWNMTVNPTR